MEEWAGFTLKWRTKLFHRRFTDKRIAVTCLRRLYLQHGINRKKVRQEKYMPGRLQQQFKTNCQNARETLSIVQRMGRRIVYLDEVNFTKRSVLLRDWSRRNSNLTVD